MVMNWERAFDNVAEGLLALDRTGTIEYANAAGAAAFGLGSETVRGRRIAEFANATETASLAGIIAHTLEDERPSEAELYLPDSARWVLVRSYPSKTGVTVFLQDITARKMAEDALRVSEAKFSGIVNISADAIVSIGADHRIIHFNHGAEEIFGWSAVEMIGQPLDALIPARYRPQHPQHIRNFAASPVEARRMGERREITALRRDGTEFPAEASISKLSVGDQRIFTVVLRDVTDRKEREANYRRLYEEAQRAVAARDDVLSFVSHDLGNPLAAIRIATAVLLRQMDASTAAGQHVAGIREAVEQAQRLIQDLLDIQRVEAGRLTLHFELLDIDRVIDDTIHGLKPLIDEKDVRIRREPADGGMVSADHGRLMQVLGNLLGNAIKFSPEGGTVAISARATEDEVIVAIKDEGPGIAEDELPHIFDRYFQAGKPGKVGHGLGLSIVQAITKAHNGRAWAESVLGTGSTFHIGLPRDAQS